MLPLTLSAQPTVNTASANANLMLLNQLQLQKDSIDQLRGEIEVLQHQLIQERQQSQQRYLDLEQKLENLSGKAPAQTAKETSVDNNAPDPLQSIIQSRSGAASSENQAATSSEMNAENQSARDANTEQGDYAQALNLIQQREFDLAIQQLESFLQRYPQSDLRANVVYWEGEVLAAQSKLNDAAQHFQQFIQKFPQSNKIPAAMYKLALIYARLGQGNQSMATLRQVIAQYPQSDAAQLAKNFLANLAT